METKKKEQNTKAEAETFAATVKGMNRDDQLMSGDDSRALEKKAKLYYGGFCCKTDFDLIRKIKALVSN